MDWVSGIPGKLGPRLNLTRLGRFELRELRETVEALIDNRVISYDRQTCVCMYSHCTN